MKKRTLFLVGLFLASVLIFVGCNEKADNSPETKEQKMETEDGREIDSQVSMGDSRQMSEDEIKVEKKELSPPLYSDAGGPNYSIISSFIDQANVFAGYLFFTGKFDKLGKVDFDKNQVLNINLSKEQLAAMKDYWTIACFGVDSGDKNLGKGNHCDANLICSINRKTGEVKLVSIFIDTYLNISKEDSYNKINAAYSLGGPTQAVAAINKNLGLNISDYVTFNWKAVADAINILGGIDVEISDADFYYMNAFVTETVKDTGIYSSHLKHAGLNHLDGVQSVAYGRLRHSYTDDTRTERQRIVIQKAFQKAMSADWATLNNIMEVVLPQVATSIEATDQRSLAQDIYKFHLGETTDFPTAKGELKKIDITTDTIIPQTLESNVVVLHQFLFGEENYEAPSDINEISSHIKEVSNISE